MTKVCLNLHSIYNYYLLGWSSSAHITKENPSGRFINTEAKDKSYGAFQPKHNMCMHLYSTSHLV